MLAIINTFDLVRPVEESFTLPSVASTMRRTESRRVPSPVSSGNSQEYGKYIVRVVPRPLAWMSHDREDYTTIYISPVMSYIEIIA